MQNVMLEYDNGQMQERYVHYDAMKRCLCMLEIKCGSDLIRTDLWSKTRDKLILFRKFITSQDLSDNTNFLAFSNHMVP